MATPGFVPRGALHALEGDLQHQSAFHPVADLAHRAEALDRVVADVAVELGQLRVGEAVIGLADRHQLGAALAVPPDAEGVVGIERRALSVAALGIHHHGIDEVGLALPLPPRALGPAGQVGTVAALQHHPLDRVGIGAGADRGGVGAGLGEIRPGREGHQRRDVDAGVIELRPRTLRDGRAAP